MPRLRNRRPPPGSTRPTRNPLGLLEFQRSSTPNWYDARLDKISIVVQGSVHALNANSLTEWHRLLDEVSHGGISVLRVRGNRDLPYLSFNSDEFTLSGKMKLARDRYEESARVRIELNLNPTRTLEYLANRFESCDFLDTREGNPLLSMAPADFFFKGYEVHNEEDGVALDGNDNVLSTVHSLGGQRPTIRSQRWGVFLQIYESKLHELLEDIVRRDPLHLTITSVLRWEDLTMPYAEVYWEYESLRAHQYLRQIAQHMLEASRTTNISVFHNSEREEIIRNLAELQVAIPLTGSGSKKLAIYEKVHNRLRFEVRYRPTPDWVRNFVNENMRRERNRLPRLAAFFQAYFQEAAEDIQVSWYQIWDLIERIDGENLNGDNLTQFLSNVLLACANTESEFSADLVDRLLLDGGVTPVDGNVVIPFNLCEELTRLGVLSHRPFMRREPRDRDIEADTGTRPIRNRGRRYSLSDNYQSLRRALLNS